MGIGGTIGAIASTLMAQVTAAILQATGSYVAIFAIASIAYLVALACIHLLAPRLEAVA